MIVNAISIKSKKAINHFRGKSYIDVDYWFVLVFISLILLGLVMLASASFSIAERELGNPFYYLIRQLLFLGVGLFIASVVFHVPLDIWEHWGGIGLVFSLILLLVILIPGVGHEVNGSSRWLSFGAINLQPSEVTKLFTIVYLASFLMRRNEEVKKSIYGSVKLTAVLAVICILFLAEPDFGAATVMVAVAFGMMFIAGVPIWHFIFLVIFVSVAFVMLAIFSPYRLERITAFMDPWADPFASGFQLTQALIAIGRGEWIGVGLGSSIQKLFYLPEAHTDFLFAVIAEELGFIGALTVILLVTMLVIRTFVIGRRAEILNEPFKGYLAYGIGLWLGIQAFTNIGVNLGLLPTKGLTLPLMSYGGSSLVILSVAMALVFKIDIETRNKTLMAKKRKDG